MLGKPIMDDKRFVDSGCSRHMTGNIAYLLDFKEFDGGKSKSGQDTKVPQSGGLPEKGSGPRCQDTILGDVDAQTRFKTISKQSNDPPLSRGYTLGSGEDTKAKTVNGERQLQALVDKKKVIITETSIRSDLHLEDAGGTDCLPTATTFEELTRMGYEKPS
ncbi:hypothetical protein Tco_1349857 [Tanacetum coccineum]